MVAKPGDPATENTALRNVSVAGIRLFIADIAVPHFFEPFFRLDPEIANAGRFLPLIIA